MRHALWIVFGTILLGYGTWSVVESRSITLLWLIESVSGWRGVVMGVAWAALGLAFLLRSGVPESVKVADLAKSASGYSFLLSGACYFAVVLGSLKMMLFP